MTAPWSAWRRRSKPRCWTLLRQSDACSASLHPVEGRSPLGIEALGAPGVHFLVARLDGVAADGCALRPGDGAGKLKRMTSATKRVLPGWMLASSRCSPGTPKACARTRHGSRPGR